MASIKGKSKQTTATPAIVELSPGPISLKQTFHVDILSVDGLLFVGSVTTPLGFPMVTPVASRSTAVIEKALMLQLSEYTAKKFVVPTLLTDGEGAVIALTTKLQSLGITVNPSGPGQHVPIIENMIRQIKERVRCHLHVLPYTLPLSLLPYLVMFCVTRIGMIPSHTRTNRVSPREGFTGRKVDFKRDLRIGFGDYAQVYNPYVQKNSTEARTIGAIALCPTGNLQGSVVFLI